MNLDIKTKSKLNKMPAFALVLVVVGLLAAQSVQASYSLSFYGSNYQGTYQSSYSGGNTLLCQYSSYGGQYGSLCSSYDWTSSPNCINYCGGNYAQGVCLVVKDSYGRCYSWNICDWNGTDQINCDLGRYFKCSEIDIYGCSNTSCDQPSTSVPEPSSFFAGAMLLVPLGVQAARKISARKQA